MTRISQPSSERRGCTWTACITATSRSSTPPSIRRRVSKGYRGTQWRGLTREEFVGYCEHLGSRATAGDPFDMHVVSIDRAGRAAVVKVAMRWNGRDHVDFLAMIRRDDGGWSISEKTFHSAT